MTLIRQNSVNHHQSHPKFKFSTTLVTEDSSLASQCLPRALSSPKKKKNPTPSTLRRNARKREEFLKTKIAPTAEKSRQEVSEEETKSPGKALTVRRHHPSPAPSSERHKVITVGREKEVPTLSQLDGATPASTPVARKDMTSSCKFCSNQEWNPGRLVMSEMSQHSKVTCPGCFVKATEVGGCEECNRGLDFRTGKRDKAHPNLKCRSCQ